MIQSNILKRSIIVLTLVITGWLLAACNGNNDKNTYTLPDLTDATIKNYEEFIDSPLITIITNEEYHDTIPTGQFIRYGDGYKTGDKVSVGTMLYLYFSKGPQPEPVDDNTPPTFTGVHNIQIPFASEFDPLEGVYAYDEVDGNLNDRIYVNPKEINTYKFAEYTIEYVVMDRSGNEARATRKVTIVKIPIDTRYTDALKMDFDYTGKSFQRDGVGLATLVSCGDGDTARFRDALTGETFSLRFYGIDTPEVAGPYTEEEAWGKAASQFTCNKLQNAKTIVLEGEGTSSGGYGRDGGWVWIDGRLLNLEILENGFSRAYGVGDSKYGQIFTDAERKTEGTQRRVYGEKDPNFNYGDE